ncbi:MAG: O-acetyl-ADP-ribose deacetylase [Verrucomicrobia bacterium ADurb.Bin345]|nr:MAG: O-acetyl-ADP-ribose deacetylase [Verrucomicrobia bacterium ADurb.Bin345]
MLAGCYRRSLEVALEHGVKSIAFPAISTGVYGYPIEEATRIAVATVREFLKQNEMQMDVVFCCFSERDLAVYSKELS